MSEVLDFSQHEVAFELDLPTLVKEMITQKQESIIFKPTVLKDQPISIKLEQRLSLIENPVRNDLYKWEFTARLIDDKNQQPLTGVQFRLTINVRQPLDSMSEITVRGNYRNQTREMTHRFKGIITLFSPLDEALVTGIAETLGKPVKRTVTTEYASVVAVMEGRGFQRKPSTTGKTQETFLEKRTVPTTTNSAVTELSQLIAPTNDDATS